ILIPSVTTAVETSVLPNSADLGGDVTSDGGATVTERGIYYGTSSDPEFSGTKVVIGSGVGSFSTTVTGLTIDTRYYFVAYATNSAGTAFGATLNFTTPAETTVADWDGNVYQTVVIGSQTWMAENLRSTHYADGTAIPLVETPSTWMDLIDTDKAYCFYNNDDNNAVPYGALYNWAGAMNGAGSSDAVPSGVQGVCPDGWHLPSDEEWKQLAMELGMSRADADGTLWRGTDEGGKLKETGTTHWESPNSGATNESGFNAIPGGSRSIMEAAFMDINRFSRMHCSTEATEIATTHIWRHAVGYNETKFQRNYYLKGNGFTVRCLKDK
ncbi:MAG: fibrobacter succinogenes major paralogous domain-containing protein, partial [Bacteroidales bacterium]|nr:fibrobacter succinogenes major paralogous domain-containing protein [Bacteroidales bacterium]